MMSFSRSKFKQASLAVFTCVLVVGTFGLFWTRCTKPPVGDYEGLIVDRWAGYTPSDKGDRPYFRLLVERETQERITVDIDADTYHRSQVGMRIKSQKGKIDLIDPKLKPNY
jgi:hypothetical protein